MKKVFLGLLMVGLLFMNLVYFSIAHAFSVNNMLNTLVSNKVVNINSTEYVQSWAEDAELRIGNIYSGELPSNHYRDKFSVKGTSYLETVQTRNDSYDKAFVDYNYEHVTAAFYNGASYYLNLEGKNKIVKKTLKIDGYTYEKGKRVNDVPNSNWRSTAGISEYYFLYGDSSIYLVSKKLDEKMPYRANYVKLLNKELIAEVYRPISDKIEYWYFFDRDTKKLAYMGYNYYDDSGKLKWSMLRKVKVFSTVIPDMSIFDVPKKYRKQKTN